MLLPEPLLKRILNKKIFLVKIIAFSSILLFTAGMITSNEIVLTQETPMGNMLRCYKKGNSGKKILLIGSVHGQERAGVLLSIKILNEVFSKNDLSNTLLCIPSANPDGSILDTRMNSNRIDLNRNFPSSNWVYVDSAKLKNEKKFFWGGAAPASEVETKFILKVDSIYNPEIILIFHQFLDCINYDGKGQALAEYLAKETGMKIEQDLGIETPGSMGSCFGMDKQKEVVTIELPKDPPDSLQQSLMNTIVRIIEKGYE